MAGERFSKGQAISFGWDTMKKNFMFFLGLLVVVFGISIGLNVIAKATEKMNIGLSMTVVLLATLINTFIQIGLIRITLIFTAQKKPSFIDLFKGFQVFLNYLVVTFLYGFITLVWGIPAFLYYFFSKVAGKVVNMPILFLLLLLIIPGIIFALKFMFSRYFVIDKNLGPIEALKESSRITHGVKWDLLIFYILLALINVAGALCLLLGLFVTVPITMIAMAYVYRQLSKTLPQAAAA